MPSPEALLSVALDMSASMPSHARAQRLVDAARRALGSDAAALLRVRDDELEPIAETGLSADLLGRRLRIAEHPRLREICESRGPVRFDPRSDLPDPPHVADFAGVLCRRIAWRYIDEADGQLELVAP